MSQTQQFKYLRRKPTSSYKQLFVHDEKGRYIAARTLYGMLVRESEPMTLEEIAADYDLPPEAVKEAIAYCESDPPELAEDYAADERHALRRQQALPTSGASSTAFRLATSQDRI